MNVVFVSDQFPIPDLEEVVMFAPGALPDVSDVKEADLLLVVGPVNGPDRAGELGGIARLAAENGCNVVFAYAGRPGGADWRFIQALADIGGTDLPSVLPCESSLPHWHEYFTLYGRSGWVFDPEGSDPLLVIATDRRSNRPSAVELGVGKGRLLLVPYHFTGSPEPALERLLSTLREHVVGNTRDIPAFLDVLRLPGEDDLLQRIRVHEEELDTMRRDASDLARFRLMVGRLSGQELENLAIGALNEVLRSTPAQAEDRVDLNVEDFWITAVGDNSREIALGEVKGIGSNVRRENVNQVDNSRSVLDRTVEDLPGLLIVNTFRNDDHLDRKTLPISEDVVRHCVRQNVLTLRTWDLFHLLALGRSDQTVGEKFLEHLVSGGGGWLEVQGDLRFHS